METLMIAALAEFSLEQLCVLFPSEFNPKVEEKTGGIKLLTLKGETQFIGQMQICDQEEDDDTMDDLKELPGVPVAFSDALEKRRLRFLIVTYSPTEQESLRRAIDLMSAAGLAQFFIDSSDIVHELAK